MEREGEYLEICEEIKKIVEETGEPLEGNCMYKHLSFDLWDCLENKRKNYQKAVKGKKRVCEIGFNAGHSILTMILVNPDAEYVLFDLGIHKYLKPCFEYFKKRFPGLNIKIIWGDSRNTLPMYHKENPEMWFDIIHIDGSHKREVYTIDWKNSLDISSAGSILIFDDTDNKKISTFIDGEIQKKVVQEATGFLQTFGYQHRILIKKYI